MDRVAARAVQAAAFDSHFGASIVYVYADTGVRSTIRTIARPRSLRTADGLLESYDELHVYSSAMTRTPRQGDRVERGTELLTVDSWIWAGLRDRYRIICTPWRAKRGPV